MPMNEGKSAQMPVTRNLQQTLWETTLPPGYDQLPAGLAWRTRCWMTRLFRSAATGALLRAVRAGGWPRRSLSWMPSWGESARTSPRQTHPGSPVSRWNWRRHENREMLPRRRCALPQ